MARLAVGPSPDPGGGAGRSSRAEPGSRSDAQIETRARYFNSHYRKAPRWKSVLVTVLIIIIAYCIYRLVR